MTTPKKLVRQTREQGGLWGRDREGLLKRLTESVLETALDEELNEYLGPGKNRAHAAIVINGDCCTNG